MLSIVLNVVQKKKKVGASVTIGSSERAGVSRSRGVTFTCSENDCLAGPGCGTAGNSAPATSEGPSGFSRIPCPSGTMGEWRERRRRERGMALNELR